MTLIEGARLGPYEILSPLGAGGMGEVYRARDTRLDRAVAIKILPQDVQRPDTLERFRREARLLSRLSHSHICALHDVGEENGVAFLVMEYLEGETLADRLESGPLSLEQALQHAVHVAEALAEAHRQGIVHRDLKPGNIMLTRGGVKVLDFGLAKPHEAGAEARSEIATRTNDLTVEGALVGTVPYMAPEQLEGRPADARTDIFAFGAVLYEMVTGARPFHGDSRASLIAAILTAAPTSLSSIRPMAPPLLDRVVRRCLAKDPDERWQTARDLAAELRFILESGSQAGLPAPVVRGRRTSHLVAGGLLGAALAAGALALLAHRSSAPAVPSFKRLTYRAGYITSARFAPDGESIVYGASWDGRPTELFMGRLGSPEARALDLPNARVLSISRSGEMALLRGGPFSVFEGNLAQAPLAGGVPRELLQDVVDADWIGDSGQLAVVKREDQRHIVEFPIGSKVYETLSFVSFLRVSPRGDRVALLEFGGPGQGDVISLDRSGRKATLSRGWVGLFGLAWAPSGDEVWFTATRPSLDEGPPAVRAVSLSGRERMVARAPTWLFLNEVFRDGRVLLGSNISRSSVRCLLPGQAQEREMGWLDSSDIRALSADGRTLLLGEGAGAPGRFDGVFAQGVAGGAPGGAAYLRKADGSPPVRLGEGHPADLSPDGKWVLATGASRQEWVLLPTGPGMPKHLPLGRISRTYVGRWLDDRRIVFAGLEPGRPVRTFVLDMDTGTVRAVTPEGVAPSWNAPAFPGGKFVVADSDHALQLYPVDGGTPRPVPLSMPWGVLAWNGDGKSLYVTEGAENVTVRNIYRQDLASGRRQLWKTIAPSDPAGIESIGPVMITPDGSCYCYTYLRSLGTLYVVEGLK